MNHLLVLILFVLAGCSMFRIESLERKTPYLRVRVVDEKSAPVENATAILYATNFADAGPSGGPGSMETRVIETVNEKGAVEFSRVPSRQLVCDGMACSLYPRTHLFLEISRRGFRTYRSQDLVVKDETVELEVNLQSE